MGRRTVCPCGDGTKGEGMKRRPTGVGLSWLGVTVTWEVVPGDAEYAQQVISELEDRRVLWGPRNPGDEPHCLESVREMRQVLKDQLKTPGLGKDLRRSLKAMSGACRKFITDGGDNGINFMQHEAAPVHAFSVALGELRSRVGLQAAVLAYHYDLDVHEDLKEILPPPDE